MTTNDMIIIFGPLIALSIGYAIMFGVYSYYVYKYGEF